MWLERLAGWVDRLWRPALRVLALLIETVGAHLLLLLNVVRWMVRPPLRLGVLIEAMVFVGFESLPIVLLISLFVGAVFALQLSSALRTFQAQAYVGATVGLALSRELAPVFTAIVVAARAVVAMLGDAPRLLTQHLVDEGLREDARPVLAAARLEGVPGNLPEVTGARRPVLLGKVSEC